MSSPQFRILSAHSGLLVTSRGLCAALSRHRSPHTHGLYMPMMPRAILVLHTNFNTLVVYTWEILSNMLDVLSPGRGRGGLVNVYGSHLCTMSFI